jgi:hypothetical protein
MNIDNVRVLQLFSYSKITLLGLLLGAKLLHPSCAILLATQQDSENLLDLPQLSLLYSFKTLINEHT